MSGGFSGVSSSLEIGFLKKIPPTLVPIRGVLGIFKVLQC
jgi:hypothetical protein